MKGTQPEFEPPLSQLLDAIEGRLEKIAGNLSYNVFRLPVVSN